MKLSVITLTWNSQEYLHDFLDSIIDDLEGSNLNYEIIILDNGSTDNTINILKKYQNKNIKFICFYNNIGTTYTRNIGLKIAKGEYILIIDSDTIIPYKKKSLKKLILEYNKTFKKSPGIIHPQLIYPDGEFQESCRKFPTLLIKILRIFNLEKIRGNVESIEKVMNKEKCRVDYAISAFWLFKRELIKQVGYLDEKIFFAPEDAEFCARLWEKGYEVWFYPDVKIVHHTQRITGKRLFSKYTILHLKGLFYFRKKYKRFLKTFSLD